MAVSELSDGAAVWLYLSCQVEQLCGCISVVRWSSCVAVSELSGGAAVWLYLSCQVEQPCDCI